MLVYGGSGSYIVDKSETIDWDKLMTKIEWPMKKKIIQDKVNLLSDSDPGNLIDLSCLLFVCL
jgi:hypothetical protein